MKYLKFLGVVAAVAVVIGCSRAPELIGVDNPAYPTASVASATRHQVFIASTRQATEAVGALYSERRAPELGLASVEVSVPPNHETGHLERAKRLPPDPRTEFAIVEPKIYGSDEAFIRAVNAELAKLPPGNRDILFFVHGYNNTTSDAVLRLAQFVEDSGYVGVPILFDWASAAKLTKYVYDLNSALIARPKVEEIGAILSRTNASGYDVFAHSMGAFLTMEAMVDASKRGRLHYARRLQTVILASPDIDMDLFRIQLQEIGEQEQEIFVLLSQDDSALNFSRRLAGGVPRVGASNSEELAELGVVAIDLTEIDDSSSGSHSKFAGSPEIVQLLGVGLNNHGRFDRATQVANLGEMLAGLPIQIVFD
ncbi:alpha/beta hydrolase [Ruegeria sp. HKCCD8929]|uniref:alpha/beta hydrolase n=1 Tax=Ruegeria sp. HKCCD8929 TaxID=2683006 RepID=UPI0035305178